MFGSERRKLAKQLRDAEWETWLTETVGGKGAVAPYGRREQARFRKMLAQYDSRVIEKQAVKWGIDIPSRLDWRDSEVSESDKRGFTTETSWLNDTGRTMISKQIRDARFAYWKGWAEILIPILSLVVAILALSKS